MLQSDRSFFRYLPASPAAREWGIYVVNAGHALVPPGSPYPPCRHPEDHQCVADRGRILPTYHLLYIAAGQGEFESKITGACRLGTGDLVILRPGMWHRYRPVLEVGWHEYWFEFDGDLAGRWMNRKEFLKAGPILHMGPVQPFLERMLDLLCHERPGSDLILGAFAAEAIAEILAALKRREEGIRPVTEVIREAKNMLAQGQANPRRMSEFAERLNMSYSAFRRLFKAETGHSPRQFVLETKMNWAREMLATSDATVNRIAAEAGFESVFYFMRLFKQRQGQTPSGFRESVRASRPNPLGAPPKREPRRPRRGSRIRG